MKEFGKLKEFGGIGKTSETVSESELASVWREKVYVCLLILKRVEVPESETIKNQVRSMTQKEGMAEKKSEQPKKKKN